jgi:hypothetical protein
MLCCAPGSLRFLKKFSTEIVQKLLKVRGSDGRHGEIQPIRTPPLAQQPGARRDALQVDVFERKPLALPAKHHLARGVQTLQASLGQHLDLRQVQARLVVETGAPHQTRPNRRILAQRFGQCLARTFP